MMSRFERTLLREGRHSGRGSNNPSFSSTLLDKIYRSIDEGDAKREDLRFHRDAMQRKQTKGSVKSNRAKCTEEEEREQEQSLDSRRDYFVQKWRESRVLRKEIDERKEIFTEFQRKLRYDQEHDQDFHFFSSTSSSSDSSSGGLSSSDTESAHGTKSKFSSYFATPKPKPIKTSVSEKTQKTEKKQSTLFSEQWKTHMIEESLIKSKARAMKIYGNLKKVKQPISPGGRLANFINSLFTSGNNSKKPSSKNSPSASNCDDGRKMKFEQASTCSSASSFSRSCLSKHSPSTRERLRNGVKRTVRFFPVSVIVDEDLRPCGHKHLYGEKEEEKQRPAAASARPTRREEEVKNQAKEKSRRVEEMAREFLKEYHKNNKKSIDEDEEEEDDDAWSYSSSDLFELDHLSVIKNDRYREELPVYETTRLDQNRAISNGLFV